MGWWGRRRGDTRGTEGAFTQGGNGWSPVSRPQEGDGDAQGSLCRIPRRRLTGDAGQGPREGSTARGWPGFPEFHCPLPGRWPSCAQPLRGPQGRAWTVGLDARGVYRGLFSVGTKCLRKDKGPPCLSPGGGGELPQSPAPASGNLQTPTERMSDSLLPPMPGHTQISETPNPAYGPARRAPVIPKEDWPLGLLTGAAQTRKRGSVGGRGRPRKVEKQGLGREAETLSAHDNGLEDLAQNQDVSLCSGSSGRS